MPACRWSRGDLLFFLDDDAVLPTDDVLARMAAAVRAPIPSSG